MFAIRLISKLVQFLGVFGIITAGLFAVNAYVGIVKTEYRLAQQQNVQIKTSMVKK